MQLLSDDVVLWADGGGKTRGAALHPLQGREAVARFVMASTRFVPGEYSVALSEVNGESAFILRSEGKIVAVLCFAISQNHVSEIRAIGNPDKLEWVSGNRHIANYESNDSEEGIS